MRTSKPNKWRGAKSDLRKWAALNFRKKSQIMCMWLCAYVWKIPKVHDPLVPPGHPYSRCLLSSTRHHGGASNRDKWPWSQAAWRRQRINGSTTLWVLLFFKVDECRMGVFGRQTQPNKRPQLHIYQPHTKHTRTFLVLALKSTLILIRRHHPQLVWVRVVFSDFAILYSTMCILRRGAREKRWFEFVVSNDGKHFTTRWLSVVDGKVLICCMYVLAPMSDVTAHITRVKRMININYKALSLDVDCLVVIFIIF